MEATTTRTALRLLAMSTEDLRNMVAYDGRFDYTPEQETRTARTLRLMADELAKREAAGGC